MRLADLNPEIFSIEDLITYGTTPLKVLSQTICMYLDNEIKPGQFSEEISCLVNEINGKAEDMQEAILRFWKHEKAKLKQPAI